MPQPEYEWNEDKNQKLKTQRGISFEEIISAINDDQLLKTIDHPNKKQYPSQKIMIISYKNYVYLVPFVSKGHKHFLKTIYPSRKYTKYYL